MVQERRRHAQALVTSPENCATKTVRVLGYIQSLHVIAKPVVCTTEHLLLPLPCAASLEDVAGEQLLVWNSEKLALMPSGSENLKSDLRTSRIY